MVASCVQRCSPSQGYITSINVVFRRAYLPILCRDSCSHDASHVRDWELEVLCDSTQKKPES